MQKLGHYFTLEEFVYSNTANENFIENIPTIPQIRSLTLLVDNILHKLRIHLAKPIIITSGFRNLELNKLVGGANDSQHTKGQAVDFIVKDMDLLKIAQWIACNLHYDQLILESYNPDDVNEGWIHVSYRKRNNRNQSYTQSNGILKEGLF